MLVEFEPCTQEFYLGLAGRLRVVAVTFQYPEHRKELLDLAARFEMLAERAAERRKAAA